MNFPSLETEMAKIVSMLKGPYPGLVPDKAKTARMQFTQDMESLINMNCFEFALHPTFAQQLSDAGYTKDAFKHWLCDRVRIPWEEFSVSQQAALLETAEKGSISVLTEDDCKPGGMIPTLNPARLSLFVAGGYAGQTMGFYGGGAGAGLSGGKNIDLVTKKITGAALTKNGR